MKLKMESACGAGAEPSLHFPNGEDRTFPPAPDAKQLSKQLAAPHSLCSALPSSQARTFRKGVHPASITELHAAFPKLLGPQEKEEEKNGMGGGRERTVHAGFFASDWGGGRLMPNWGGEAQKQTMKLLNRIP